MFNLINYFFMKKKRIFFGLFLLAVAGLWTGCSNDDEVANTSRDKQAISFYVQSGTPILRAGGTTESYVNAFVVYGTDNEAVANSLPNIFNGITVARQAGSANTFDYNPKKYYSEGAANAVFAAYSPVSKFISGTSFVFGTGFSFNYTVPAPGSQGTGNTAQEDLLVAGITAATPTPTVHFAFQHALARIFVKATSALSETVTIKGLTLKNLHSSGTITGTPAAGTPWEYPAAWNWATSGARTYDYSYELADAGMAVQANQTTPILVTSMEQGMMIIPQDIVNTGDDVTADDFALEVVYDLANLTGKVAYIYLTDGYSFEMGNQYAITIDFNPTIVPDVIEIGFTISVNAFGPIIDAN